MHDNATTSTNSSTSISSSDKVVRVTNIQLLQSSSNCRYFFLSHFVTQIGFSLNLIASLALLGKLDLDAAASESSNDADLSSSSVAEVKMLPIAGLLFLRLLPPLIISPIIGGPLADAYNKRTIMIACDLISSVTVLLFPLAAYLESKHLVYIAAFSLSFVDSIYICSKSAIVTFIVNHEPEMVKTAAALLAVLWSATNAIGSAIGGWITAKVGYEACFYINVATFVASVVLMSFVGDMPTTKRKESFEDEHESVNLIANKSVDSNSSAVSSVEDHVSASKKEVKSIFQYLSSKRSIPLLFPFIKALGALIWGAADILTFVFSKNSPQSLGLIYGATGFGCLIGTLTLDSIDRIIPAPKLKSDSQTSHDLMGCLVGVFLISIGFVGMSFDSGGFGDNYDLALVVIWSIVKSVGSAYLWVYSALLIQLLTDPNFLGRVYAIENASCTFTEGLSSFVAAILIDYLGISGYSISRYIGMIGLSFIALPMYAFWSCRYKNKSPNASGSSGTNTATAIVEIENGVMIEVEVQEGAGESEGLVSSGSGSEMRKMEMEMESNVAVDFNESNERDTNGLELTRRRGLSVSEGGGSV